MVHKGKAKKKSPVLSVRGYSYDNIHRKPLIHLGFLYLCWYRSFSNDYSQ